MSKHMKFVGLLTTALVAPALFSAPATAGQAVPESMSRSEMQLNLTNSRAITPITDAMFAKLNANSSTSSSTNTLNRLLFWHGVMQDANARDHTPGFSTGDQNGPTRNSRAFAIVEIAVFDAVNSIARKYRRYSPTVVPAAAGASTDAAIAYAAHDTLVALYPQQISRFNVFLTSDMANITGSAASKAAGRAAGSAAAVAILALRVGDGAQIPEPVFGGGGALSGGSLATVRAGQSVNGGQTSAPNWTPDPIGRNSANMIRRVALGAFWGNVKPFVLTSGDQFRIPAVPAPNTASFRSAFQEVKAIGASSDTPGSTATAATKFIGNFWGYDGAPLLGTPPRLYNQIAVKVANDQGLTNVVDYARYLALINSAMGDSGIAAWDSKFFHNYWRPVTGIPRAAEDGDPTTIALAAWKPVGASVINSDHAELFTPPFPAYPSGHATFGGALFQVMRSFFPNNTRFTFVSDEYSGNGVDPNGNPRPLAPVRYRSLQAAQEENGQSRIFNGVHWQYDNTQGQALGVRIANYTLNNAFQRVRGNDDDDDD